MKKGETSRGAFISLALCLAGVPPASAADCNRNGVEDWLEVTSGSQPDCNGNEIPDPCDILPVNYGLAAMRSPRVAPEPHSVVAADFDGDGALDLAATVEGQFVSMVWNDGHGSFSEPHGYSIGGPGSDIAAGDLDGDRRQDVLVVTETGISLLINQGSRLFSPAAIEVDAADLPLRAPILADLDGDGDLDLAVLSPFRVLIFRNRGDGVFPPPAGVIPVGSNPVAMAAGKLDGDEDIDLVTANHLDSAVLFDNISVLLNRGGGEFELPRSFSVGRIPTSIAAGDLDGDGDADLATACAAGKTIHLFLGAGDGTFRQQSPIPAVESPHVAPIVDLDGDGDVDLTVSGLGSGGLSVLLVFLNHGRANFAKRRVFPDGFRAGRAVIGDLTGDGGPDLAVPVPAHQSIFVLERVAVAHDADCNATGIPDGCEEGGNDCNLNGVPDCGDIAFGVSEDCDRNGIPDECDPDCNESGTNDACELAAGTSSDCNANGVPDECDIGTTKLQFDSRSRSNGSSFHEFVAADLDRDGSLDLISVSRMTRAAVLWNDGQGGFDVPIDVPGLAEVIGVAAGDVDGDDDLDIVAADFEGRVVVLSQDARSFELAAAIDLSLPWGVGLVDIEPDGDLDVYAITNATGVFLTNEGGNRFEFLPDVTFAGVPNRFHFADMDSDGRVDLVTQSNAPTIGVFWNSGGRFTEMTDLHSNGRFAVADLDGDSDLDVVCRIPGGFSIVLQDSPREFHLTQGIITVVPLGAGFLVLDVDRDGDADLVAPLSTSGRGFVIFRNDGRNNFDEPVLFPFDVSLGLMTAGDYDGNGMLDLAAPGKPPCILDCSNDELVMVFLNRTWPARSSDADQDDRPDECDRGAFRRGDSGGEGSVDIADAVFTLRALFQGGPAPGCTEAADADNDGKVDLADPVLTLEFLFRGGPPPAPPGPASCGLDPDPAGAPGDLGCGTYGSC